MACSFYRSVKAAVRPAFAVVTVCSLALHLQAASALSGSPPELHSSTTEKIGTRANVRVELGSELSPSQTRELEVEFVETAAAFTLQMYEAKVVRANFSLYCIHPSVQYALTWAVLNRDVARAVGEGRQLNLSCQHAELRHAYGQPGSSPEETAAAPASRKLGDWRSSAAVYSDAALLEKRKLAFLSTIPVVEGFFNLTLSPDLLGRTWFRVVGTRHSEPLAKVLPWALTFAWKAPKPLSDAFRNPAATTMSAGNASEPDVINDVEHELQRHMVTVMRTVRMIDNAFRIILFGFVMLSTIGMGCKTEVAVVKAVLKKPVAPAIGFFCQYLAMPLIAYLLARTLTVGDLAVSLGIFACGVCPGGGPSNMFTFLLDGDVSLSVTMTAISSIAALAMIPLWLFTLGSHFDDDKVSLKVPFGRIILTLAFLIIPLFIGMLIKQYLPRAAQVIVKVLKPFTIVALIFIVVFGVYTNLYVFRLFAPRTLAAGCLLPYIGYIIGALVSAILRQPFYRITTIAIETGIQNTSIAYLLLIFSLPAPDGDMAAVGPMASALMTPLPLFVIVIAYLLYKRFCKKRKEGEEEGSEDEAKREDKKENDEDAADEVMGSRKKEKKGDAVAPIYKGRSKADDKHRGKNGKLETMVMLGRKRKATENYRKESEDGHFLSTEEVV